MMPAAPQDRRLPQGPGQGALVLRMWAQQAEIKKLIWGGKQWRKLRPNMAEELNACAAAMEACAVELLRARALLVAIADNPGAAAISIQFGDDAKTVRELVAATMVNVQRVTPPKEGN